MKLKLHVKHNGKHYLAGAECPKDLEPLFSKRGYLATEADAKVEAKKEEKKGKEPKDSVRVEVKANTEKAKED